MKRRIFLPSLLLVAMLQGCAGPEDKDHYGLATPNLHIYRNGQYINYQISGDKLSWDGEPRLVNGQIRVSWRDDIPPTPPGLGDVALLAETTITTLSDQSERTDVRHVAQRENGRLVTYAVRGSGGSTYWVTPDGGQSFGIDTLPSPLDGSVGTSDAFSNLDPCETSCANAVGNLTYTSVWQGTETVTTPLAVFDTYVFKISGRTAEANALTAADGRVWIYPPIGVVQYDITLTRSTGADLEQLTYVAKIAATNIDLGAPLAQ